VGCGTADPASDAAVDLEPTELQLSMETTRYFDIAPHDVGSSVVRFRATGDWVIGEQVIDLEIVDGRVGVEADEDGNLHVVQLDMSFNDLTIAEEAHPPTGLHLTDLRVQLAEQASCDADWSEELASGESIMNLDLDWSAIQSTGPKPLATAHLEDLPFRVEVIPDDDGSLSLEVSVHREGDVWELGTLVHIHELRAELTDLREVGTGGPLH
jgi:hypothetical protein